MGIRHSHLPIHGIQFHPESIGSVEGVEIFKSFLALQSDAWRIKSISPDMGEEDADL